jgi:hypothetical protein
MAPDEIFVRLAGMSARLSEIRFQVVRSDQRVLQAFRTREIDPFLEEVDRQFKIFSRIQTVKEWELKMAGTYT